MWEYAVYQVTGPAGVALSQTCRSIDFGLGARQVDYQGNGLYSFTLTTYPDGDSGCTTPLATVTAQFTITAGTGLTSRDGTTLLTRERNSSSTIGHTIDIAPNPGALGYEVRFAEDGVIDSTGAISGPSEDLFDFNERTQVFISEPGRSVLVARAQGYSGAAGQFFSPWSAPLRLKAIAPFDLEPGSPELTDARGPTYRLRAEIRERRARGRVGIELARGRGGRYRSIGSARIRRGRISARFRRQAGTYRVKLTFRGSAWVGTRDRADAAAAPPLTVALPPPPTVTLAAHVRAPLQAGS